MSQLDDLLPLEPNKYRIQESIDKKNYEDFEAALAAKQKEKEQRREEKRQKRGMIHKLIILNGNPDKEKREKRHKKEERKKEKKAKKAKVEGGWQEKPASDLYSTTATIPPSEPEEDAVAAAGPLPPPVEPKLERVRSVRLSISPPRMNGC